MHSVNNFENLLEVVGRSFDDLQAKLVSIPHPCSIVKLDREPTGKYYAVVQLDRPSDRVKPNLEKRGRGRPKATETVGITGE